MHSPHPPTTIRVTVPVSQEVLDKFKLLSAVSGMSVGRAMGEWLSDTASGLDFMIQTLQTARKAPQKAIADLNSYAGTLNTMTQEIMAQTSIGGPAGVAAALGGAAIAAAKGKKLPPTPSSNTGGELVGEKQRSLKGKP